MSLYNIKYCQRDSIPRNYFTVLNLDTQVLQRKIFKKYANPNFTNKKMYLQVMDQVADDENYYATNPSLVCTHIMHNCLLAIIKKKCLLFFRVTPHLSRFVRVVPSPAPRAMIPAYAVCVSANWLRCVRCPHTRQRRR